MIVAGGSRDYTKRHPSAKEIGVVIEVADSSRVRDLGLKKRLYARSKVTEYWVLDLTKSRLEVFTEPSGPSDEPDYGTRQVFTAKQRVPVVLNGKKIASILVSEILP